MRAVVQRVSRATVTIAQKEQASIQKGLLVLIAAGKGDTENDAAWMAKKIPTLRIFPDHQGKMNRSLKEINAEMIVVSQFTLYGDCRKGRRPSFVQAMEPQKAAELCELFIQQIQEQGISCGSGEFGANMQVMLINDGPVTLWLDSRTEKGNHL